MFGPAPGARWHTVLANSIGAVYTVRSTTGGSCAGFRESSGVASIECDRTVAADALALSTGTDDKQSVIFGLTGTNIAKVVVKLRSGRTLTIEPTRGYILRQLPHVSRHPSAGVAQVQGLDRAGHVIAHQTSRR